MKFAGFTLKKAMQASCTMDWMSPIASTSRNVCFMPHQPPMRNAMIQPVTTQIGAKRCDTLIASAAISSVCNVICVKSPSQPSANVPNVLPQHCPSCAIKTARAGETPHLTRIGAQSSTGMPNPDAPCSR